MLIIIDKLYAEIEALGLFSFFLLFLSFFFSFFPLTLLIFQKMVPCCFCYTGFYIRLVLSCTLKCVLLHHKRLFVSDSDSSAG